LIFLDIELGDMLGVDVGRYIRNKLNNYFMEIVFISAYDKYDRELFDLQPLNFLRKAINEESIENCIDLAIKRMNVKFKTYRYNVSKIERKAYLGIYYILKAIRERLG
jgi:two-component SAPR family response regulator